MHLHDFWRHLKKRILPPRRPSGDSGGGTHQRRQGLLRLPFAVLPPPEFNAGSPAGDEDGRRQGFLRIPGVPLAGFLPPLFVGIPHGSSSWSDHHGHVRSVFFPARGDDTHGGGVNAHARTGCSPPRPEHAAETARVRGRWWRGDSALSPPSPPSPALHGGWPVVSATDPALSRPFPVPCELFRLLIHGIKNCEHDTLMNHTTINCNNIDSKLH
ncbi:hypothetical protein SEVIR_1G134450v4 [Setaria viridis]